MNLSEITLPDMSGGLNTREPQEKIADNQSPDMLNLWYKDKALIKRPGQQMAIVNLEGSVHGISEEYNGLRIIHAGSRFYIWDEEGAMNYKGTFDPADGYPESLSPGDYYTAKAAGTVDGVAYKQGDRAVYCPEAAQTETAAVQGTVREEGTAKVTVASREFEDSRIEFNVTLKLYNTPEASAAQIRAALKANGELSALFTVGGENAGVTLIRKIPGVYDNTFNIAIHAVTCEGITDTPESAPVSMMHNAVSEITPAVTASAVQDKKGTFVLFGETVYYIDGTEIWSIYNENGLWKYAAVEPYVPVVMINCKADLSDSTDNEAYNLLDGGFCVKYNGNSNNDVCYYVATVPDEDTFTITDILGSTTPMSLGDTGTAGWKVRKQGEGWLYSDSETDKEPVALAYDSGEPSNVIKYKKHGFQVLDIVEFTDGDKGKLPKNISAFDLQFDRVFKLPIPDDGLTEEVSVTVFDDNHKGGIDLTSGKDFTFDKAAGVVDFSKGDTPFGAPGTGTDNIWITAYAADPGGVRKKKITGCKSAITFGGESGGLNGGTRVFVTGNANHPQNYWHSDVGMHVGSGMGYFPDTAEEYLDQTPGAVTAMAKMGGELVIFKESSIFAVKYSYDGKDVYFPVRECHGFTGCDIPGSVQLIDNRLVFANTKNGVNMLISTNNDLEDIVKPLSANINSLLLSETKLSDAGSCDYGQYYWLCAGGNVYLWDYGKTPYYNYSDYGQAQRRLAWYRFKGIPARSFVQGSSMLYYGFEDGIACFTENKEDFGKAYDSYYISKAFDLGNPDTLKTFMFAYPSFAADGNIKAVVTAGSEETDERVVREFDIKSFGWGHFNWEVFTWNIIKFAKTYAIRLGINKASYIQIKVSGNEAGRGVGLSGLRITYLTNGKVKG